MLFLLNQYKRAIERKNRSMIETKAKQIENRLAACRDFTKRDFWVARYTQISIG